MSLNTIIFDLGGVLIDWNPRYLYRKLIANEEEMAYFLTHICTPDWNEQQDAGRPLQQATEEKVREFPEYAELIRAYYGRWPEMLAGPISGTVRILEKILELGTYRLLALTNWSAETFPIAWERYSFLRHFEGILVSGKEGLKKPDPAIYRLLFDRFEVQPDRAVFIDDNLRNIRSADQLGLRTIHFQNPEHLARLLRKHEVMVDPPLD